MSRLDRLIELRDVLESAINECDSKRDLAALARQYRETLKEIEEIEGAEANDDDIAAIISERKTAGKAGAVR
jgi:DNA-binding ferritin-like protein